MQYGRSTKEIKYQKNALVHLGVSKVFCLFLSPEFLIKLSQVSYFLYTYKRDEN